jgi:hypothetical protein
MESRFSVQLKYVTGKGDERQQQPLVTGGKQAFPNPRLGETGGCEACLATTRRVQGKVNRASVATRKNEGSQCRVESKRKRLPR